MNKGLEALRELDLKHSCFATDREYFLMEQITKELKALKIIKEKSILIECLMDAITLGDYNCQVLSWNKLTQEEFSLLKEVLEDA